MWKLPKNEKMNAENETKWTWMMWIYSFVFPSKIEWSSVKWKWSSAECHLNDHCHSPARRWQPKNHRKKKRIQKRFHFTFEMMTILHSKGKHRRIARPKLHLSWLLFWRVFFSLLLPQFELILHLDNSILFSSRFLRFVCHRRWTECCFNSLSSIGIRFFASFFSCSRSMALFSLWRYSLSASQTSFKHSNSHRH